MKYIDLTEQDFYNHGKLCDDKGRHTSDYALKLLGIDKKEYLLLDNFLDHPVVKLVNDLDLYLFYGSKRRFHLSS